MSRELVLSDGPTIIGMVHLRPTLGAPHPEKIDLVVRRAVEDAIALERGGVDAVLIENFFDFPYYPDRVPPETITSVTVAVLEVMRSVSVPVGVNILRNDSLASLAIAQATGASFIRVNVLTDAYVTDQGIIEGRAYELLRARSRLESICGKVKILADVRVKHASPLSTRPIVEEALDAYERGGADVIVITGTRTGIPPTKNSLMKLRRELKDVPLFLGSGINPRNVSLLRYADGAIVGSYFKEGGISSPVSEDRVRSLMEVIRSLK